jgi:hypothetical protein
MNGELARYRIEDMVREAEAHRRSRDTAAARSQARRARIRRAAGTLAATVVWPFRH